MMVRLFAICERDDIAPIPVEQINELTAGGLIIVREEKAPPMPQTTLFMAT